MKTNLQDVIQEAITLAGFQGIAETAITISFDLPPIRWRDIYATHEGYHNACGKIPGVVADAGQGEGYAFEIDAFKYTADSERNLLALLKQTREREEQQRG